MQKTSHGRTAALDLRFLGQPRVLLGGQEVPFPRRKVLALLAYLAVTSRPHTRDELAELLFPGRQRDRAYGDLRLVLSYLRDAIGEEWISAAPPLVAMGRQKGLAVDVVEFRALLGRAERDGSRDRLARAANLYRGRFLSAFSLKDCPDFEQWQGSLEESLRQDHAVALGKLIDLDVQRGELETAIEWASAAVDNDPLEEAAHRRLMSVLAAAGRRSHALRQYDRLRSMLAKELGEAPDAETEALREQISSAKVPLMPRQAAHAGTESLPAGPGIFLIARVGAGPRRVNRATANGAAGRTPAGSITRALRRSGGSVVSSTPAEVRSTFTSASAAMAAALALTADGAAIIAAGGEPDWERASSLLRAANVGQILVSDAVAALAREALRGHDTPWHLPAGAALQSLGAHVLDDLGPPLTIHQLGRRDALSRQPAPKTLDAFPGNLRSQPTPIIGRRCELDAVIRLLRQDEVRVLTLTGTGGTGKTRLAMHAAAPLVPLLAHGAWFVDLAAVSDPANVVPAIGRTVGFSQAPGDTRPLVEGLRDFLAAREMVLILDNFEHVMPAAPVVADLASGCPGLKVLVTSREPLHLRGEREYPVPPLGCASAGADRRALAASEAVRLYAARARAVDPDFALTEENASVVADICVGVDCLPLAIELAAAWIKVLPLAAIRERLSSRLELLAGGASDLPARQKGLRSEIAWSYDLLDPLEQSLFRDLGVFVGGCSLDGARSVCSAPGVIQGLATLVDKNLLKSLTAGVEPRFRMLETIREFACERLGDHGEAAGARERFAAWAVALAEESARDLFGPQCARGFERLDAEYDNLEQALAWMLDDGRIEEGSRLAGALGWYWFRRGKFTVGQQWLARFGALCDASVDPVHARVLTYRGWMWLMLGSNALWSPEALECFRQGSVLWRKAGNTAGEAICTAWLAIERVALEHRDMADAECRVLLGHSVELARSSGDPWALSFCLKVAHSYSSRADLDLSVKTSALEEAIRLARETGDPFLICQAVHGMGDVYLFAKDFRAAETWFLEALVMATRIGDTWSAFDTRWHLGWGYVDLGDLDKARTCFADALRAAIAAGARSYYATFLRGLAWVARGGGDPHRALRLAGATASTPETIWDPSEDNLGLSPEAFEREWARGRAMSIEEAVHYGLEGQGEGAPAGTPGKGGT